MKKMNKPSSIRRYVVSHKRNVSAVLAFIVAFITVMVLIHPALSLTYKVKELNCNYQVHQHTDDCYTIITGEEGQEEKVLICGQADYVIHEHNEDCYQDGVLVCTLPEIAEHKHTKSCYTEEKELICGKEGEEGHTHTEDCYKTVKVLTCGQQELHTHTKKCYDKDGQLTCGMQELKEHKHGKACITEREMTAEEVSEMNDTEQEAAAEVQEEKDEQEKSEAQITDQPEYAVQPESADQADDVDQAGNVAQSEADDQKISSSADKTAEAADSKDMQSDSSTEPDNKKAEEKSENSEKSENKDEQRIFFSSEEKEDTDASKGRNSKGTSMEKIVLASDGHNYKVTVTCGTDAGIPENADLSVEEITKKSSEYDTYVANTENALGMEEGSAGYIRLFDIKIVDKDNPEVKYQPAEGTTVDVKIELADSESNTLSVVHFADGNSHGDIVNAETDKHSVNFEAKSFSIYAVVDEGEGGDNARMTLNFYGKDQTTLLATVYIKNSDTLEQLHDIIYDPGAGDIDTSELFRGWIIDEPNYTTADAENAKDIAQIREWAESEEIQEGEVHNIYAMIYKTYSVTFKDEDGVTIHAKALIFKASDGSTSYQVQQPYTPKTQDEDFQGWYWTSPNGDGVKFKETTVLNGVTYNPGDIWPQNIPIPNESSVTIEDHVVFSPNVPKGYWLSFSENGKGASYTPPQFIPSAGDTVTEEPAAPTRFGYTFGGWYTDENCTDGNRFTFGGKISGRTTLYAKWVPAQTANYTVIIWQEKSGDTYASNVASGSRNYDFVEAITLNGNVGATIGAVRRSTYNNQRVTDGDGTQYYNALVNGVAKSYTGYHCATFDTDVTIVPEGTSVVNVYYDRNIVKYTFHYPYGYTYTETTGTSGTQYGYYNNEYVRIYYNNGTWYRTRTGGMWGGYTYSNPYSGTRYTRSNNQSWQTYQEETGLYGETLNWPSDSSIYWYPNGSSSGTTSGTRMTYKSAFLPLDADMTVDYYGVSGSGDQEIRFCTQDLENPNNYTLQYSVSASNVGTFNVNDKFTGFYAYQTRSYTDGYWGGSWSNWADVGKLDPSTGIYGKGVAVNDILEIRFNRIKNTIAFMDGSYFNGNGVKLDEENRGKLNETQEYYYEADLTSYNVGGAKYYTPAAPTGYAFGGWYADETCTRPYDFTTMPVTGVTVYAKWVQKQYRVFLHPNVPESDTSLEWGQTGQQMNFRVDYGGKINGGNQIMGERTDYELIGWYTDAACTKPYNFDAYVLNDTTVTAAYDKTVDMTDEMNKYGNIVDPGSAYNSDVDRFWITKKLDLYAKWRAKLVGAPGINVQYDAVPGEGTFPGGGTMHTDPLTYYLDRAEATAHAASIPSDDEKQFMYWVVQRWDETEGKFVDTEEHVYPGDTFEVLKAYAHEEDIEPDPSTPDVNKKYTVQLRAEYEPKDAPKPTHITWYANNGTGDTVSDTALQINQTVDIRPATTFTREGYRFLGWARLTEVSNEAGVVTSIGGASPVNLKLDNLDEDDLFLKYDSATGKFVATVNTGGGITPGKTISKIAADERLDYHGMVAVWQRSYTVKVKKLVVGTNDDKNIEFAFTENENIGGVPGTETFNLKDREEKEYTYKFPAGSHFSVAETPNADFDISLMAEYTDENGTKHSITKDSAGNAFVNGSDIEIQGDTEITVTNTRKAKKIRILKVDDSNSPVPLEGVKFTLNNQELTSGEAGYTETVTLNASDSAYTLSETGPLKDYDGLKADVDVLVSSAGVTVSGDNAVTVTGPDNNGVYTLVVTNTKKTVPIKVVKIDQSGNPLAGATFTGDLINSSVTTTVSGTGDEAEAIIINDAAVPLGTYTISETGTPAGYLPLEGDVVITIASNDTGTDINVSASIGETEIGANHIQRDDVTGLRTIEIMNSAGVELPSTGGPGTNLIYITGIILTALAGAGLVMRKKRRNTLWEPGG